MKVYLIGYMGSGKTTIGKKVAEKLQWQFLDMDEIIEKRYEMEVADIFRLYGEGEFRGAEQDVLQELSSVDNVIISTGGGAPCFFDNMDQMKRTGMTIYINLTPTVLAERLLATNLGSRPILAQLKKEELEKFIAENLSKRNSFYTQAQHQISGTDEEIVNNVMQIVQQ